ncbi:hypothetical protein L208DRAFT_1317113 [Tricholoma matsutake]|nr:hypothetical protein L208DRAFT_1317113 [Tricholoma matsutake 945]
MPTALPCVPAPPIDTSPEQPLLSETIDDSVNNDKWRQDLWDPIEGETKQQVEQWLAHNHKIKKEHNKKLKNKGKNIEEEICRHHQYNKLRPGRVPDSLGVVTVSQFLERNNTFHGMLAWHFYHSPSSNRVLAGNMAARAARAEMDGVTPYTPEDNHQLYYMARHGLPMNPQEVHNLAALIANPHKLAINRAEGFLLLGKLRQLTSLCSHCRRDRVMLTALEDDYHPSHLTPPFVKGHPIWAHERIPHDMSSWTLTGPHHNNPGLAAPNTDQPFMLADWARYILYHGRPGTPNQFISVAFDYALQVHYRSVFGFQLGHCAPHPPLVGHCSSATLLVSSWYLVAMLSISQTHRHRPPPLNPSFPLPGQSP